MGTVRSAVSRSALASFLLLGLLPGCKEGRYCPTPPLEPGGQAGEGGASSGAKPAKAQAGEGAREAGTAGEVSAGLAGGDTAGGRSSGAQGGDSSVAGASGLTAAGTDQGGTDQGGTLSRAGYGGQGIAEHTAGAGNPGGAGAAGQSGTGDRGGVAGVSGEPGNVGARGGSGNPAGGPGDGGTAAASGSPAGTGGSAGGGTAGAPHQSGTGGDGGVEISARGGDAGQGGQRESLGGSSSGDAGAGGEPAPLDPCVNLPQTAVPTQEIPEIDPIEDITFDDNGYLYWNTEEGILRTDATGSTSVFVPNISFYAGLRMAPNGDLYVANNGSGNSLDRISPDGSRETLVTGVSLNGLEVDAESRAYMTVFGGQRVLRYDPATEETTVLNDTISTPNGITLSPDFNTLYFDSWGGSPTRTIYRLPIMPDGSPGLLENWANDLGTGTHDGMAVDECGNVYVANSGGAGQIVRISADNPYDRVVVVERPGETLHNFVWGRGNGWSARRLYIVSLSQGLFWADVGIGGKEYE